MFPFINWCDNYCASLFHYNVSIKLGELQKEKQIKKYIVQIDAARGCVLHKRGMVRRFCILCLRVSVVLFWRSVLTRCHSRALNSSRPWLLAMDLTAHCAHNVVLTGWIMRAFWQSYIAEHFMFAHFTGSAVPGDYCNPWYQDSVGLPLTKNFPGQLVYISLFH